MRGYKFLFILLLILCAYAKESTAGYTILHKVYVTARVEVNGGGAPPVAHALSHTPLDKVNILGDQIVLTVTLASQSSYSNCYLYYRIKGATPYTRKDFTPKITTNMTSWHGEAIIPGRDVTEAGIEYYIQALGASNTWNFKSSAAPQVISFGEQESLTYTKNNDHTITLKDGNTYDGEASLMVSVYPENGTVIFQQRVQNDDLPRNNLPNVLNNQPVMVYKVEPLSSVLVGPSKLNLLYLDVDRDGKEDTTGLDENLFKIFWFDGYEWRYVGGEVNSVANTILASIYRFGIFGIFPISGVDQNAYKPLEKIITPNGDGVNDTILFSGLTGDFEIKIVDITGRLVKLITDLPYWDGKDMNGNDSPGGVYFYQLKQNGKYLKGTFVIAR